MSLIPRGWDQARQVGSVALRVEEHLSDRSTGGPPVLGLRVYDAQSGVVAGYRPGSALYGFLGLPQGTRRLILEDPSGRYVTRALEVRVQDPPLILRARIRPGPAFPVPSGQLALWGDVVNGEGAPAAYALLRLRHASGARWTTTTDATGRYLFWPRGLPARDPDEGPWSFTLELRARAGATGLDALPADLDALDAAALAAWFNQGRAPVNLRAPQSTRTHVPTLNLSL